jgi:RHH-type proline utilization regulon transcriptional repressor/proline dehydrogenase/delta 1-pyrroline-5-carboxylate dehydrogenase
MNMKRARIERTLERAATQGWDDERLAREAVGLAEEILGAALQEQRWAERYEAWRLHRLLADPSGKTFTLALADQVFRPPTAARAASQLRSLVRVHGAPRFLPLHERIALRAAATASRLAPAWVMRAVTATLRRATHNIILPAEEDALARHVAQRREMGARLNLNLLGEAILGEEEAERRLAENLRQLEGPDCDYISVKISSIFSQVNVLAYQDTLERIKEPLRRLYRTALASPLDGRPRFVNLDMEEYRDLHLTCDAFRAVLDEDEFQALEAGIVLQAYLPDSFALQQDLTAWARERRARGGAGIKLRIVKGANLAMEKVDAAVHGWEQAPYQSKHEVDANFKRMLHHACAPEHAAAVRVGVGSHNLFDLAYALLLREREGVRDRVEPEMLEGMANHQARVVEQVAGGLLFYAPVVRRDSFHSAIAYLVRRLDENTAPENFLHDLFGMRVGGPLWQQQRERFLSACAASQTVGSRPARR